MPLCFSENHIGPLFIHLLFPYSYFQPIKLTIMKSNWTQILVFNALSLILGFILGRVTGNDHGNVEKRIIMKHLDG
jgi:hypothetical protein